MQKLNIRIAKSSPLYGFWKTSQDDLEEDKRLLIINEQSPASKLLKEEPYKWENLFQSIVREINSGDISSIKALNILLDTLKEEERNRTLFLLKEFSIFDDNTFKHINNYENYKYTESRKVFRFAKILLAIFSNPYGIEIKRTKTQLYERTGSFINNIRKFLI